MGAERRAREADGAVSGAGAGRVLLGAEVCGCDQATDADKVWMRERGLDVIAEQYRRQEVALLQAPPAAQ